MLVSLRPVPQAGQLSFCLIPEKNQIPIYSLSLPESPISSYASLLGASALAVCLASVLGDYRGCTSADLLPGPPVSQATASWLLLSPDLKPNSFSQRREEVVPLLQVMAFLIVLAPETLVRGGGQTHFWEAQHPWNRGVDAQSIPLPGSQLPGSLW